MYLVINAKWRGSILSIYKKVKQQKFQKKLFLKLFKFPCWEIFLFDYHIITEVLKNSRKFNDWVWENTHARWSLTGLLTFFLLKKVLIKKSEKYFLHFSTLILICWLFRQLFLAIDLDLRWCLMIFWIRKLVIIKKKLLLIYRKHLFTTSFNNKNRFKLILSISIFFVGRFRHFYIDRLVDHLV